MELQQSKLAGIGTIKWEDEDTGFEHEGKQSQEFANLLDESETANEIKEGSIVNGTVVRFTDDSVIVDIGHKSEGEIPKGEFRTADGELSVKEGETVEVYLDSFEDNDGEMVLSRERAEMLRAWDRISDAYENNEIVEGTVVARVKGGLSVDIGVKAFLPGSQVDLRPVRNLDKLIGVELSFKIIKFNKKRGNIVLSRRVLLEQDREKMQQDLDDTHELFKDFISQHRPQVNMQKVGTGEYWFGTRAKALDLVDALQTSDDYLLSAAKNADVYRIKYIIKKSLGKKLAQSAKQSLAELNSVF